MHPISLNGTLNAVLSVWLFRRAFSMVDEDTLLGISPDRWCTYSLNNQESAQIEAKLPQMGSGVDQKSPMALPKEEVC